MDSQAIEAFAKQIVEHVRDAAVRNCDALLKPESRGPVAERWRQAARRSPEEAQATAIPDCVDETVFWVLQAIDQGLLRLKFVTADGRDVDLCEGGLGELSGEYMASGGWRAQHSKERFVDDFADLTLD